VTPSFTGFSGNSASIPSSVLTWTIDPGGDGLSSYVATCTAGSSTLTERGATSEGTVSSGGSVLTLPVTFGNLAPSTTYSCTLTLTDATGSTYTDTPQSVVTTSVQWPGQTFSTGAFIALEGSCSGSACQGSGYASETELASTVAAIVGPHRGSTKAKPPVVLGRFRFHFKAHSHGKITFELTKAGRALLRRDHRLKATLTITVRVKGRSLTTHTPLLVIYRR
jgi:hypothetical protein